MCGSLLACRDPDSNTECDARVEKGKKEGETAWRLLHFSIDVQVGASRFRLRREMKGTLQSGIAMGIGSD